MSGPLLSPRPSSYGTGARRLCILVGVAIFAVAFFWMAFTTNEQFFFEVAVGAICGASAWVLARLVYWVRDGFAKDQQTPL